MSLTSGELQGGGWCIHGVAYGPNWTCGRCSPGQSPGIAATYSFVPPNPWTEERVQRLFVLLESIDTRLRNLR